MSYTYKDDLDLLEDKKKDSKKLTLNALNAASDLGLDPTYGGDGSDEEGGGGEETGSKTIHGRFVVSENASRDVYYLLCSTVSQDNDMAHVFPQIIGATVAGELELPINGEVFEFETDIPVSDSGTIIMNFTNETTVDMFTCEGDITPLTSVDSDCLGFIATGDFTLTFNGSNDVSDES